MRASAQVWGLRGDVPAVTTDLRPLGTQAPPSLNKTIEHDLRLRHMHTPAARMHHSPIRGCPHWRPDAHHTRRGTSPSYEVEVRASHTGHRSTQGCSGWWSGGAGSWQQVCMAFHTAALRLLGGVHIKTLSEASHIITKIQPGPGCEGHSRTLNTTDCSPKCSVAAHRHSRAQNTRVHRGTDEGGLQSHV